MTWTNLTFAFNSLLTSSKMTQLSDNITALANGDSGAPEIIGAALATGAVDSTQLASGAVHQVDLDTSTGEVSTGSSSNLTLPGGSYGFYPQLKGDSVGADITGQISSGLVPGTSYVTNIYLSESGADDTAYAQQRYVNSSPPFDLGDGEIPFFSFVKLDKTSKKVIATYCADVPPWAYNGPTNIQGKVIDKTGIKYRRTFVFDKETGLFEPEWEEVTQAIKNADMDLIPHPFLDYDSKKEVVILIDPTETEKLLNLSQIGESVSKLIHEGHLLFSGDELKRNAPKGVKVSELKWRSNIKSIKNVVTKPRS